jgi:hypothetical protein
MEGSCEHGSGPSGSINCWKFLSSYAIEGFSRRAQLHEVSYNFSVCDDGHNFDAISECTYCHMTVTKL